MTINGTSPSVPKPPGYRIAEACSWPATTVGWLHPSRCRTPMRRALRTA